MPFQDISWNYQQMEKYNAYIKLEYSKAAQDINCHKNMVGNK